MTTVTLDNLQVISFTQLLIHARLAEWSKSAFNPHGIKAFFKPPLVFYFEDLDGRRLVPKRFLVRDKSMGELKAAINPDRKECSFENSELTLYLAYTESIIVEF